MQQGAKIILAMDNDEAGRKLARIIEHLVLEAEGAVFCVDIHLPEEQGWDWNDCLKARNAANTPAPVTNP